MSIYDGLNNEQKNGVMTTEGPVLILAGAGSGKTRVITHRIAHLIEDLGVGGYNILAITFTNKAANEMRERVDNLVGMGAGDAWIMTFHAACVRILRRFIDRIGYGTNFSIYDTDDQKAVMKDICKRLDVDTKVYKEKTLLSQISNAKNEMIGPDEMYQRSGGNYNLMKVSEIYREYQEQLKKNNALDFDDILNMTVKLLESESEVLEYFQDRFKYIMVDEYQDTNAVQFRLINLLARKHHNICVVGDDDQSIYKFRGADIKNILNFEEYFPEAKVIKLEQNYRSTQNILDAANSVISNNISRKNKSLWTDSGEGTKIAMNIYENGYLEADGVAEDIERNTEEGYGYNDFAILYRTNAQSRALEEKLLEHNIPYKIYGGINFYGRKEIKDILAYLKTIDNAADDLSVKRILNVPKRGIGAASMAKIDEYAYNNDIGFYDALCEADKIPPLGKTVAKITPFTSLIKMFRSSQTQYSIDELIRNIVDQTGYIDYLLDSDTPEVVEERQNNIEELISKAVIYEQTEDEPTLSGFLEQVALVADIDSMDDSNNVVTLMTLHSAKGLEFPIVYMTGMEEGLFPSYMSISSGDESDIEEERRLCYVGITRAKEKLIMSSAKIRMVNGETRLNKNSRFVGEIPSEYILTTGQSSIRKAVEPTYIPRKRTEATPIQSFQKEAITKGAFDKKPALGGGLDYEVGDTVKHAKFGTGIVKDIKSGGRDYEVTVEFDNFGIKKMFAAFANLQKF